MSDEISYTSWGLEGVRRADVIFAYLEASNPGGPGLALEIGFAAAMNEASPDPGKHILFVCEPEHPQARYHGMARVCSDEVFETLEQGIKALVTQLSVRWALREK